MSTPTPAVAQPVQPPANEAVDRMVNDNSNKWSAYAKELDQPGKFEQLIETIQHVDLASVDILLRKAPHLFLEIDVSARDVAPGIKDLVSEMRSSWEGFSQESSRLSLPCIHVILNLSFELL